jgi:hypothetical protein
MDAVEISSFAWPSIAMSFSSQASFGKKIRIPRNYVIINLDPFALEHNLAAKKRRDSSAIQC